MALQNDFGSAEKEYESLRFSAGVINLSEWGVLRATGRDRVRYLHHMLSNDIKSLRSGEGCYATLLTNQGRMESDLYVYASDEELWMECPPAGKESVLANLKKYLISDVVELEDWTERIGILSFQGPEARERVQELFGITLELKPLEHRETVSPGSGTAIRWNSSFNVLRIVHRDRTGCSGYDLWLPRSEFEDAWKLCIDTLGVVPAGYEALNRLRTEAGIPWFGIDMDNHNLPLEFGLNNAISLNKGCYRGQEIMARVTYRGHLNRGFGGIAVSDEKIPGHGTVVSANGAKIGGVSSAAFSPKLHAPLALALLKKDFMAPGTGVELSLENGFVSGTVVTLPLP